jgi:undecaprenyl pyrophosphate synthase
MVADEHQGDLCLQFVGEDRVQRFPLWDLSSWHVTKFSKWHWKTDEKKQIQTIIQRINQNYSNVSLYV